MQTVNAGASTVVVDSVIGINVNDTLQHASLSLSGITTVTNVNTGSKTLTFKCPFRCYRSATRSHAIDTNTAVD